MAEAKKNAKGSGAAEAAVENGASRGAAEGRAASDFESPAYHVQRVHIDHRGGR